jgi:phospholipid/cholesterol/gamma-HCH transport system substrate-binding protein
MPSQKELRWSQLKVGVLTFAALAALTVLIFILSGSTGGLFTPKLTLYAYFENANGLKVGAPVAIDGVTVGNVRSVRVVPSHEPKAVEVISRVGAKFLPGLHTDSTVAINQAGVLGDAFLDISSVHATGPQPPDHFTFTATVKPGIQEVISSSQQSIDSANVVIKKIGVLIDSVNSGKGTIGMLVNDPTMARKITLTIDQLQALTQSIANGKGSVGKLLKDDELYNRLDQTVDNLNRITARIDNGEGTAGKLLRDDTLYKNLNTAISNTNELLGNINAGKGSLGKLAKDPALANKVEESITHLNTLLKGMQEGQGTLGQLVVNRQLYDTLDKTLTDTGQLISAIRKDPKTYLTIHVKVF